MTLVWRVVRIFLVSNGDSIMEASGDDVQLTAGAADRIRELLAEEDDADGKGLRLFIERGGCSGMQYGMVFDERRDDDSVTERAGVRVYVDKVSLDYLRGVTLDFSDSLNDGGFKILNPNAKQSCGCGKSFQA